MSLDLSFTLQVHSVLHPCNPQATPISPDCSWPYPRGHLYRTTSSGRNPVRTGSGQSPDYGWQVPPLVTWTSCDDMQHVHSGLLISRPPLRQPGIEGSNPCSLYIFLLYCLPNSSSMAPQLLHTYLLSFPTWAQLYVPPFHICASVPSFPCGQPL